MNQIISPSSRPIRRRATVKQDYIVQALRQDIVTGRLKPDSQLPNQLELVQRFGVSTVTIQRALERLTRDGFIVRQPRQGVFVGSHPPHLVDYCLIFPFEAAELAQSNRFLFSLHQIASRFTTSGHKRVSLYFGVDGAGNSKAYNELLDQAQTHRTAGLIFLSRPHAFIGTPLLTNDSLPRVAIMAEPRIPGVTAIQLGSYLDRAMDWLRDQGSKRIAMVCAPQVSERGLEQWMQGAQARGMNMPRHLIISCSIQHPHWARYAVESLMDRPADARPDGLIIADDNLVPHATAGLMACGVSVPDDCRVVAHGNFPWATECLVPALRLGPDTRQVFQACLDVIDAARQGQAMPERVHVPMTCQDQVSDTSTVGQTYIPLDEQ